MLFLLAESNAELRRIMITKYGMARYLEESGAKELDRDRDTKGERILYSKQDKMGKETKNKLVLVFLFFCKMQK